MGSWTIKCLSGTSAGTEQTLAAWKLGGAVIHNQSNAQDAVSFTSVLGNAAASAVFNYRDRAALYYTDDEGVKTRRFVGVWDRLPRSIEPQRQSIKFGLLGTPWHYLNRCVFQTLWAMTEELVSTLKPSGIIGLDADGLTINAEYIVTQALDWCLHCGLGQTAGAIVPFTVGTVNLNNIFTPLDQTDGQSCAETILTALGWAPDCAFTVDYSEPTAGDPPKVNIIPRSARAVVSLPAYGAPMQAIKEITARPDLQVDGVIVKYDTIETIDGTPYREQAVDAYPVGCNELSYDALVVAVNLAGGSATYQKNKIGTITRPIHKDDAVALGWIRKKLPWLYDVTDSANGNSAPTSIFDTANIVIDDITTTIDANDEYATDAPTGFTTADILVEEVVTGAVAPWQLVENGGGDYAAKVNVRVTLGYTGTDDKTKRLFKNNPDQPGTFLFYEPITATTAASGTYSHLANFNPGEQQPAGLAQCIYNSLSQLHYEGSIVLKEVQCSGLVAVDNTLNLTGGAAEWATMQAQVTSVEENIDRGETTVSFGPPKTLGVDQMIKQARAARRRVPPSNSSSQSNANGSAGNIDGHKHTHSSHQHRPPLLDEPDPWEVSLRKNPASPLDYQFSVNPHSFLQNLQTSGDRITVTGADGSWSAIDSSIKYIYIKAPVSSLGVTSASIESCSSGGDYDDSADLMQAHSYIEGDGETPPNQAYFRYPIATIDWTGLAPVSKNVSGGNNLIIEHQTRKSSSSTPPLSCAVIYPGPSTTGLTA